MGVVGPRMTQSQPSFWDAVSPVDNSWRTFDKFSHPRLSETAAADKCVKCHSAIWSLWCRTGFKTHLDPELLDVQADLDAYLAKRETYWITRCAGGWEAEYRLPIDIIRDTYQKPILAKHICDMDNIRTDWPDYFNQRRSTTDLPEEAPF